MPNEQSHLCGSGRQRRMSGMPRASCTSCGAIDRQQAEIHERQKDTHVAVCYKCRESWNPINGKCECGGGWSQWVKKDAATHYAEQARQAAAFTDGELVKVDGDGMIVLGGDNNEIVF